MVDEGLSGPADTGGALLLTGILLYTGLCEHSDSPLQSRHVLCDESRQIANTSLNVKISYKQGDNGSGFTFSCAGTRQQYFRCCVSGCSRRRAPPSPAPFRLRLRHRRLLGHGGLGVGGAR